MYPEYPDLKEHVFSELSELADFIPVGWIVFFVYIELATFWDHCKRQGKPDFVTTESNNCQHLNCDFQLGKCQVWAMKERNALVSNLVNCELCQLFLLWKYFEEGFHCNMRHKNSLFYCDLCWNVPWIYPDLKKHVLCKLPELAFIMGMLLFQ